MNYNPQEGSFKATDTCGAAGSTTCTVTGTARVEQFTTDIVKFNLFMTGSGIVPSAKYKVYVVASCTTTVTDSALLVEQTTPFIMINGVQIYGRTTDFIADGTVTGKTAVKGNYLSVYNSDGTLIGCTDAAMT